LEQGAEWCARERVPVEDVLETCRLHAFERAGEALRRVREVQLETGLRTDLERVAPRVRRLAVAFSELRRDELERHRRERARVASAGGGIRCAHEAPRP